MQPCSAVAFVTPAMYWARQPLLIKHAWSIFGHFCRAQVRSPVHWSSFAQPLQVSTQFRLTHALQVSFSWSAAAQVAPASAPPSVVALPPDPAAPLSVTLPPDPAAPLSVTLPPDPAAPLSVTLPPDPAAPLSVVPADPAAPPSVEVPPDPPDPPCPAAPFELAGVSESLLLQPTARAHAPIIPKRASTL